MQNVGLLVQLDSPDYTFRRWWQSETRDVHFTIASFLSTVYFVWMTFYRKDKGRSEASGVIENNKINT